MKLSDYYIYGSIKDKITDINGKVMIRPTSIVNITDGLNKQSAIWIRLFTRILN